MIARFTSAASAAFLTGTVMTGVAALIAFDIGGEDLLQGIWNVLSAPFQEHQEVPTDVAGISIFRSQPIAGASAEVTTGFRFASQSDLTANKPEYVWCYIQERGDNTALSVTLFRQEPPAPPAYTDVTRVPEADLDRLGLERSVLAGLARTHCQPMRTESEGGGDVAVA